MGELPVNKAEETKKSPVNPLDKDINVKSSEPALIENIVSTETRKEERILEEAPEIDVSLMQEVAPPKSLLLLVLKISFGIFVALFLASFVFFTSQLSTTFDFALSSLEVSNISNDLAASNSEILRLKTDMNLYAYLKIKAYLDEFSFYGDSYIQNYEIANSQTASEREKTDAVTTIKALKDYLKESFSSVKAKFALDFTAPLKSVDSSDEDLKAKFEEQLTIALTKKAEDLVNSTDLQAVRDYKNYNQTLNLVGNTALKDLVVATDFDALSDKDLYKLIKKINSLIVNDLSIIQAIKDARIKWSDVINEIKLRTKAVDTYYSDNFYNELGGIRYTSYDFDSVASTITITGETKRFDTANFTMISNLIDELNRSPLFENAGMNSFSKSGTIDAGYLASIRMVLNLQKEEMALGDQSVETTELPGFLEDEINK